MSSTQTIEFPLASEPRKPGARIDFSMGGLVYCAMMLFMGLAAINTQANLLFGVFGLMIGVLLLAWYVGRRVLRDLEVRRVIPPHAIVGTGITFEYEFTNTKTFWPSLSVGLLENDGVGGFDRRPRCYLLHAAAGMTARVQTQVHPARRGLYRLDHYELTTSFPFGFVRRRRTQRREDSLLIFPPIGQVDRKLLVMCRSADDTGESLRPSPGGSDEFYGIRRYRAGDNPRRIYWRRSARTGVLLTKEMTRVAPPRLLIVVDTRLEHRTRQDHALVERAIAIAASLASAALEDGLAVGICVWNGKPVVLAPSRGKQQREDILSLLAQLPLNLNYQRHALMEDSRPALRPNTTTVLVTGSDVKLDFLEEARGSVMLLSAANRDIDRWFAFPAKIDFAKCGPPDQRPPEDVR